MKRTMLVLIAMILVMRWTLSDGTLTAHTERWAFRVTMLETYTFLTTRDYRATGAENGSAMRGSKERLARWRQMRHDTNHNLQNAVDH